MTDGFKRCSVLAAVFCAGTGIVVDLQKMQVRITVFFRLENAGVQELFPHYHVEEWN